MNTAPDDFPKSVYSKTSPRDDLFPWIALVHWTAKKTHFKEKETLNPLISAGIADCCAVAEIARQSIGRGDNRLRCNLRSAEWSGPPAAIQVYGHLFVTDHTFWTLRDRLMTLSLNALVWEQLRLMDRDTVYTAADLTYLGEKYLTAAIAPTAVAFLSRQGRLVGKARELTLAVGVGTSLLEDHLKLRRDLRTGRNTALISDLQLCQKCNGPDLGDLEHYRWATEAIGKNLQRARLYYRRAATLAKNLQMQGARCFAQEKIAFINKEFHRLEETISPLNTNPEAPLGPS